jgi:hypothetical protein
MNHPALLLEHLPQKSLLAPQMKTQLRNTITDLVINLYGMSTLIYCELGHIHIHVLRNGKSLLINSWCMSQTFSEIKC